MLPSIRWCTRSTVRSRTEAAACGLINEAVPFAKLEERCGSSRSSWRPFRCRRCAQKLIVNQAYDGLIERDGPWGDNSQANPHERPDPSNVIPLRGTASGVKWARWMRRRGF